MIEARGAEHAYVYMIKATRSGDGRLNHTHAMAFDVANSDDEACGRAMRMAQVQFPQAAGWGQHYALTQRISGFDWVGPHDFSKIQPAE